MGILNWDKPKKALAKADWKDSYGFEDGPTGGYVPNMDEDARKQWKAKITGQKLGFPQVEIRKSTPTCEMTIIVNLGKGYNYKWYRAADTERHGVNTKANGINIHIAQNGPATMTFEDFADMQTAIAEAKAALEALAVN